MSNAVQAAVEFQQKHPNDTLILVTADHETGGMAIGYKTTNYDTFLTNLAHQKMSYAKFDSTYVQNYIANKTPFEADHAGCDAGRYRPGSAGQKAGWHSGEQALAAPSEGRDLPCRTGGPAAESI